MSMNRASVVLSNCTVRPGTSQKSSTMKVSSNTPSSRIGCADAAVASGIEATPVRAAAAAIRESLMVSPSLGATTSSTPSRTRRPTAARRHAR
jgi:hypothetical protein